MKQQILDKTKKKKIIEELKIFGITKIPYLLLKTGKEKIRAYSGSFSSDELQMLGKILRIEEVGMYFAKETIDGRSKQRVVRLNLDAAHVLQKQISGNIIDLDDAQEEAWFLGKDVEVEGGEIGGEIVGGSFVVLKSGEDIVGVGRLSSDKTMISNYMPKERRVRS